MIRAEKGEPVALQADATREADVQRVIAAAADRFGPLDILHNNVGASIALGDAPADTLTEAAFDRSFAVNLKTAWLATKHVLPAFRSRGRGSIVNISSLAAAQAYPLLGYKTMKAIAARDSRIPLGRKMGTGWDVAHAALFLHSDEAAFITGSVLVVDGGELVAHGL
jgi:NAD(P)-dependent dehydrogenase (short-subunit alcohol dehydrogenase family)